MEAQLARRQPRANYGSALALALTATLLAGAVVGYGIGTALHARNDIAPDVSGASLSGVSPAKVRDSEPFLTGAAPELITPARVHDSEPFLSGAAPSTTQVRARDDWPFISAESSQTDTHDDVQALPAEPSFSNH